MPPNTGSEWGMGAILVAVLAVFFRWFQSDFRRYTEAIERNNSLMVEMTQAMTTIASTVSMDRLEERKYEDKHDKMLRALCREHKIDPDFPERGLIRTPNGE